MRAILNDSDIIIIIITVMIMITSIMIITIIKNVSIRVMLVRATTMQTHIQSSNLADQKYANKCSNKYTHFRDCKWL